MTNKQHYSYAVGRRKSATATVKLYAGGRGQFTLSLPGGSTMSLAEYFGGNVYLLDTALAGFYAIDKDLFRKYDAEISVSGGGIAGQADAMKLAFSRALKEGSPDHRSALKPLGLLKRDGRIKERKKPGLKKARKSPTWSKR